MFILYANKNQLMVCQSEPITSGSVNVYRARFEFSPDWKCMTRIAVFKYGGASVSVLLDDTNECVIPWEAMSTPGRNLVAGVYGKRGDTIVLPTIWASLGRILEGVTTGPGAQPPTPELWEQELARKGDRLDYTEDGELDLYSGDKLLSSVKVSGGGSSWGVGHGLKVVDGDLTVDTTDNFTGDNTLPMTAAGVQATVGNIEILLETI